MPDADLIAMLGMSKDEILSRVIDRIATQLLENTFVDDEDYEHRRPSGLQERLRSLVQARADAKVAEIAEREILPKVGTFVETLTLNETNKWGERTGKTMTFIEYLIARAEAYLTEVVNIEGQSAEETQRGYFTKHSSRTAFLVHKHLQFSIETAMKKAVADANEAIVGGLEQAVKVALEDVGKRLKVEVKTR